MADITTPTNTLAIRPDRMALLTERDRVVDRLDRLERAASGGMLGSGGGGGASTPGDTWQSAAYAPATTAVAGWKLTPFPADASYIKTGDGAAFTRNTDGSLTVRDAGVYEINAMVQVGGSATVETKGLVLSKGINEAVNVASDFLNQASVLIGGAPYLTTPFVGYLPAGQVISLISYVATSQVRQCLHFQIARQGVGPKGLDGAQGAPGPQGPQGPIGNTGAQGSQGIQGVPGVMDVYEQPTQPSSGANGAIWIDTDDVPPAWASFIPVVSALPSNPVEGQEVYYQPAGSTGPLWHLRYHDTMGLTFYEWDFLGGSALESVVQPSHTFTADGVFRDPSTVGPDITIPLPGDYRYEFSALVTAGATGAGTSWVGVALGAGANPVDPHMTAINNPVVSARTAHTWGQSMTGLNKTQLLRLRYAVSGGGTASVISRRLRITPIRVSR